jgi:hypothetical protein
MISITSRFHRVWHSLTSRRIILYWIVIWLSGMLTWDYYARIEAPTIEGRISLHHDIVIGSAPYQFRYRVLLPYTAEAIARLMQQFPIVRSRPIIQPLSYSRLAFTLAYCFLDMTALFVLLGSLGELVWKMFNYDLALVGISMSAFLINFTFRDHYFQPWSFWEGAFFAYGLLLIHRQQYWIFSGVSVLSLMNRETSVFLLLAFLFCTLPQKLSRETLIKAFGTRDVRFAIGNLIVWVLGFLVLHQIVGYRPSTFFVQTALSGNLAHLKYAFVLNFLLFGFISPLVIKGIFLSPSLVHRSAMMLPAYFGLLLVIGYWWEIRYWITVIPIVIPALIAATVSASLRASQVSTTSMC